MLWRGKINLPKGLFDQQLFRSILRYFWPGGENFPVSLRAALRCLLGYRRFYKNRKMAYSSARAPLSKKLTRHVFAKHWAGRSQRTWVRSAPWVDHLGASGSTAWRRSRFSWCFVWPVRCLRAAINFATETTKPMFRLSFVTGSAIIIDREGARKFLSSLASASNPHKLRPWL